MSLFTRINLLVLFALAFQHKNWAITFVDLAQSCSTAICTLHSSRKRKKRLVGLVQQQGERERKSKRQIKRETERERVRERGVRASYKFQLVGNRFVFGPQHLSVRFLRQTLECCRPCFILSEFWTLHLFIVDTTSWATTSHATFFFYT